MSVVVHDIVQVVVYRRHEGQTEYLIIKRVPQDGGFWQPVTGHIESGETHTQALLRELAEETGLQELLRVSAALHSYEYELRGEPGRDTVYAVEVAPHSTITLAPDEHEAYEWLPLQEALDRLKYEGNKESLRKTHQYMQLS